MNNHVSMISVEIIYAASKDVIFHYMLKVEEGTTVLEAVKRSPLPQVCPILDINRASMGIFSKKVSRPEIQQVMDGDRVELYRPLQVDPNALRKKRENKSNFNKKEQ